MPPLALSGIARLVPLGGHTAIFDCSIRVYRSESSIILPLLYVKEYSDYSFEKEYSNTNILFI